MNKYDIKDFLKKKLGEHATTLRKASFDSAKNEHLCGDNSTGHVYDFDDYVKKNYSNHELPASPDAILLGDKKLYFIEFKNQVPGRIDKKSMRDKFGKGTCVLKGLLKDFVPRDIEFVFCVVHQSENNRYFNSGHIESMASRFGLEEENAKLGGFYSNIIAENIDHYKRTFRQLQC